MPPNVTTLFSDSHNIERLLPQTDLLIGAVLIVGAKAPNLVTREMLKMMKKGSARRTEMAPKMEPFFHQKSMEKSMRKSMPKKLGKSKKHRCENGYIF